MRHGLDVAFDIGNMRHAPKTGVDLRKRFKIMTHDALVLFIGANARARTHAYRGEPGSTRHASCVITLLGGPDDDPDAADILMADDRGRYR